ncbi:MAG: hypothetical protein WC523_06250 [Patescibacteria group bacterium]|jgi:hypothetical protein
MDTIDTDEFMNNSGVIRAILTSPPIDKSIAEREQRLDKKYGYTVFGAKIPPAWLKRSKKH